MIGYCGLNCHKCGAFVATKNNDNTLRIKVAEEWTQLYKIPVKPEDIHCTGCQSSGIKTYYSDQLCEIRKCAKPKAVSSCAACSDYPCPKLQDLQKAVPEAKANLDALRTK